MTPYVLLVIVVGLLSVASHIVATQGASEPPSRRWTLFDIASCAALVTFGALRHNVGTDYPNYLRIYTNLDTSSLQAAIYGSPQEIGFTTLMYLSRSISDSPYAVFWLSSLLTIIPTYLAFKRSSSIFPISVMLYVFLMFPGSFNAMRSSISVSIMLYASTFLGTSRLRFALLVLFAGSIHASALVAGLLFVAARNAKPTAFNVSVVLTGAVVTGLLFERVSFIASWFEILNPRYGTAFDERPGGIGAYLMIVAYLALLVLATQMGSRRSPLNSIENQLAFYVLIGIAIMIIGVNVMIIYRMSDYFVVFITVLLPSRLSVTKQSFLPTLVILLSCFAYFVLHVSFFNEVIPYQTRLIW